jgi:hypothetical protein
VDLDLESLDVPLAKAEYIETHKGVTADDVYEVFNNAPHFYRNTTDRGAPAVMLGPNHAGRFLMVPIAPAEFPGGWYVVTAYWLRSRRGRQKYER